MCPRIVFFFQSRVLELALKLRPSCAIRQWSGVIFLLSIAVSGLLSSGCSGLSTAELPLTRQAVTFERSDAGGPPHGFLTALTGGGGPVSWVVREVPDAPDRKPVLVQESSDETRYRFPVCVYDKVVARDVAVQVKFKAVSGKVDQAGGIVLRYSPENYYIARANALEDNVNLYKMVRGKRIRIKEAAIKVTTGEWHTLRFEAKGRKLTVAFDGRVMIDTTDGSFVRPGRVGLWTKADSVSAFADLQIESPLARIPTP